MLHALTPYRVTPPAGLPVSLAEAKQHLRVEHAVDDALINALIEAATSHLDGWAGILGRCLINQVWAVQLPGFAGQDYLRLPFPDVSAAAISYRDAAGASQALPSGETLLVNDSLGGALWLVADAAWPVTARRPDAVTVTFTAGYGADAAAVPAPIRTAILLIVGDLYKNREAQVPERMRDNPFLAMTLAPYRRAGL